MLKRFKDRAIFMKKTLSELRFCQSKTKWDKSSKKQRWFCHQCHRSFLWKNSSNKYTRQFVWFKHWIVDGYTFRQLADQSGHSLSTIRRIIESGSSNRRLRTMNYIRFATARSSMGASLNGAKGFLP
jgi:transposase-like protein